MQNTRAGLRAYFQKLVDQHPDLKMLVYGGARRIVQGARSEFEYPLLWLEPPVVVVNDKDGTAPSGARQFALVVVDQYEAGNDQQQVAKEDAAEALLIEVLIRMRRDRKEEGFSFVMNQSVIEAIDPLSAANEVGCRIELQLEKPLEFCYNAARWADS